jgi:hypothetical protein
MTQQVGDLLQLRLLMEIGGIGGAEGRIFRHG